MILEAARRLMFRKADMPTRPHQAEADRRCRAADQSAPCPVLSAIDRKIAISRRGLYLTRPQQPCILPVIPAKVGIHSLYQLQLFLSRFHQSVRKWPSE